MDIEVKMGEVAVTKNPDCLVATGVGSCLVVTLYDPKNKIGGMAHAMIARPQCAVIARSETTRQSSAFTRDAKYVEDAIDAVIDKMAEGGSKRIDMEAKLVGAANMFAAIDSDMSKETVRAAKRKLKCEHIIILGESVGGNIGRSVELNPKSGMVTVSIKF